MRYTECKMAPLAMEMVRDITENAVDFKPNYDGKESEPVVLPSRFPNLLVNGSTGIAVGMATNIPAHNLREVASAVQWSLEHPEAPAEELLDAALERVHGPDFPNGALIVGRRGLDEAYRTGRGSVIMRAVVDIEEDRAGRTQLVVTELPTWSTRTIWRSRSPSWSPPASSTASLISATTPQRVPASGW